MKNILLIIGMTVAFIAVTCIFLYNFTNASGHFGGNGADANQENDGVENSANLNCTVIDNSTQIPIENAVVYLGTGYPNCHTDNEGKCQIKSFPFGDYGLGIFKEGYDRYTASTHFAKGNTSLLIELGKKPEIPQQISINGKVIENVTAEGSMSENHYFTIKGDGGEEYYIFNEIGQNSWDYDSWNAFINKSVRITGFIDVGYIGWQHQEAEGVYVESIELTSGS